MMNSYKEDEMSVDKPKIVTIARLLRYLLKYKGRISIVLLLMGFGTCVQLINPLFFEAAVDKYIMPKDLQGFIRLVILAAALNLGLVLAIKLRMLLMAKTSNQVILEIREQLYTHIETLDLNFFDSRPIGKILARITGDVNSLKDIMENCVTTLIPELITVIAVGVIMFTKNWRLALASLFSLPPMMIGVWVISKKSHNYWQLFRKKQSNMSAFVNEDFSGMKVIHSFNAQNETNATFRSIIGEYRGAFVNAVKWGDAYWSVIDLCWSLGTMAMYYVGIKVIGVTDVSIGTYIAFGTYIGMFWQPIMNLSQFYNQLVTTVSGAERVFEIMDTEAKLVDKEDAVEMPQIQGNVKFNNVTFSYTGKENVLENVSFDIVAGKTVALVGPTGAGKSTIVNLISRFYDVQEGAVLIDGYDIRDVTINSLRTQMGVMTQDNFIFSGTIRDNIRYGKLDATEEEIIAAAKVVHAHEFIEKMEKGYDTELTSRGGELSKGQGQLVAFARTMLSDPRILILDEATSSIDTKTEQLIQKGIAALLKGRTSFVIAHRLSTIQNADIIFVVDEKNILEAGTHEELLAKKGKYWKLVEDAKA
ncbi:MAG: ABC transporter ATP-binding protein/permease [Treponema sp.]|nr:ABC transporter ATP-binding protein/permease [Treponema sp.]